jgi:hypothetical protein
MPRYIPIQGDNLSLIEQEVKTKKVVTKKGPVNFIWIFDRSGSMTYMLPELTAQLIDLSKKLPLGSFITLGWFSSENNQYDWIFKGFKISENSDYKFLEAAIKKNSHSLGCTCFSEILTDVDTVIKDLTVLSKTFSLHFFTDGYPVVNNYRKELDTIFSAIKKIKGRIHTAIMVGYGHGYNKTLMADMSEKLGAILIHSSMIPEYANSITRLVELSKNSEPKEEVEPLLSKPLAIFTITDQGIVLYAPDEDGKLYISPTKGDSTKIYYVSTEKPNKKSWDKVETTDVNFGDNGDQLSKALYAAALVMTQQTKSDIALEILGKVGDKAVIDSLNSAFQVEEYGAVENTINLAIQDVGLRFSKGRDTNYLPPADAFCVFDVLNTLVDDEDAAFFPYDSRFKYERIGVASTAKDDYAKFVPDKSSKCPFRNLTWHESRLNLSVQTRVNGTVALVERNGTSPVELGLANPYPAFVYRNFSFVKDGHTHTKIFYITSSEDTYKQFKNKGIVIDDTFKTDKVYGLDIGKLPAINRKIAEGKTSATDLCKAALQEHRLKAKIKALKYLKGQEIPEETKEVAGLTDEQVAFLKASGFSMDRDGSYNPPTEKADPVDFYMAKFFDIKLSGISSLPTVKKVQEKIVVGKALTPSETLIEEGLKAWNVKKVFFSGSTEEKARWFDGTIKDLQRQMRILRATIQMNKFSVILGKAWYQEFAGKRENCELTVDNVKCVFELGEEKVPV